jgi:hypothetical protein
MIETGTAREVRVMADRRIGGEPTAGNAASGLRAIVVAAVVLAGVVLVLVLFGYSAPAPPVPSTAAQAGPFGLPLDARLAYVGTDRVMYLLDLTTGEVLGSKAIPADRRPAAVSTDDVYLGRLTATPGESNWDYWRALPWEGTVYRDVGPGRWLLWSPGMGAVVAAAEPTPGGRNGVLLADADAASLIESAGRWGSLTTVGGGVLAKESLGTTETWWLLGSGPATERVPLPPGFRPVAGGPDVVAGRAGERAVLVALPSGAVVDLAGPLGEAAAWAPDGRLLATAVAEPPTLCAYDRSGTAQWCRMLEEPTSPHWHGIAWSPDGSFLVAAEAGTLAAFTASGERIGRLDTLAPTPQTAAAWVEVLPDG